VNGLEFLSVAADADGRFRPLARSPMERRLRDAGAEFEERDGWLVAVRVPGEEERRLAIRDVTHDPSNRLLLAGVSERPEALVGFAALEIAGPGALTVLRRLTEMPLDDLPAVGAAAHIRCWIFRTRDEAYRLLFEQEYGHYLWEVVIDAARPLGGGPGGTP
jgi:glycine cleavage system aminomethyltransferase T